LETRCEFVEDRAEAKAARFIGQNIYIFSEEEIYAHQSRIPTKNLSAT
jgi:hypothetical protein